jgi:metallo-beta-lactamase family protein
LQITFLGAAGSVTGSCHLVECGGRKLLLDCGQVQGTRTEQERNRAPLPVALDEVEAVVLSHAHIDHSGRLPLLRRQGYGGPIYTHDATRALCEIMLPDAAFLQERDAYGENKRRQRKGLPLIQPLYVRADAEAVLEQFVGMPYGEERELMPGVTMRLHDAGHILGAAIVELTLEEGGKRRRVVFSGDLGFRDAPLLHDPTRIEHADYVLMESTYGGRNHRSFAATLEELKSIFLRAAADGGNVLIPAFAVGRTQDLLYLLAEHYDEWQIGRWRVYLDSPMAIEATAVYRHYRHLYRDSSSFARGVKTLPNLVATRTTEESMQINNVESGAVIIAGSGMCNGGRIRHHLKHNLWRAECDVVFIGFQAQGTLGRKIVDGADRVRLWQETVQVRAGIHTVGGLSAHADQTGLLDWYGGFGARPPVSLVHGEPQAMQALASSLQHRYGVQAHMPVLGESRPL